MRNIFLIIFFVLPLALLGQNTLESNRTEYVYEVYPDDTSQQILTHIYINDSCGNNVEFTNFEYSDGLPFDEQFSQEAVIRKKGFRTYMYNEGCQVIQMEVLDGNKKLLKRFQYQYDKQGNELEMKTTDDKGNQLARYSYQYNANKKRIQEIRFNQNDTVDHVTTFEYMHGKKVMEIRSKKGIEDTIVCKHNYSIKGQLVMKEWSKLDGSEKEYELCFYQRGQKVKELFIDGSSGNVEEYRTSYYENGLERTWSEHDYLSGEIVQLTISKYEFEH